MATIKTKFDIGDHVFSAATRSTQKRRPCPDCLGAKKWETTSPAGTKYAFGCPRCSNAYLSNRRLSLKYLAFVGHVEPMTIGSVRYDSEDQTAYMCEETGIGSGTLHPESSLFSSRDDAKREADKKAEAANSTHVQAIKQYDDSLRLCDYQLSEAVMNDANDKDIHRRTCVQMLFEDLRDEETASEEIIKILEDFSFD